MILNNSIKKKIQTAVTLALISSGIIPAVKAEVNDANVDNPAGTTIDQGLGTKAVDLDNGSTFTITNAGTISASGSNNTMISINVDSSTTVSTLTNSGTILGETTTTSYRAGRGISIDSHASIGTLTNSGTITGQGRWYDGRGIYMSSTNGTLSSFINTSSGIIQGISGEGINGGQTNRGYVAIGASLFASDSISTTFDNDGIIRGLSDTSYARGVLESNKVGTFDNSGTILGQTDTHDAMGMESAYYGARSMDTLNNSGTISGVTGTSDATGIKLEKSSYGTINNSGTINATATTSASYGVYLYGFSGGDATITNFNNTGTISASSGTTNSYGFLFAGYGDGLVTNFTNTGTISSSVGSGSDVFDIYLNATGGMYGTPDPTITNLNNSQGKDGNDVLTYKGKLPTNYNVIVNSTSDYGQISFNSATGTTNFGVYNTSTLSGGTTYASVIQGIATAKIGATRTGTLGSCSWTLQLQDGETTVWDLVIAITEGCGTEQESSSAEESSSRTSYSLRIISNKRSEIAAILEAMNTAGTNSALTSALDGLSDVEFNKALSQIEGVTIKSVNGNSFQKHSSFKRAVSSTLSAPSVSSLTKNNYASLNFSDLRLSNEQNQFHVHSFNDFDFKSLAKIYENKDLFSLKSKDSTLFIRTFADNLNQNKFDDNIGYEATTVGFLIGNENNPTNEINQGWSIGYSDSDSDFDESQGDSQSKTIHAMLYQKQEFDNYTLSLNLGSYLSRSDMDRKITEGVSQTLNSRAYNYGFDVTAGISHSYELKNEYIFTPSFSTNIGYIIQDDLDESGGSVALTVDNDNLLIVKPEIGFALDKKFKNTENQSKTFGFSVYGSYEDKLDGTTSNAKIKGSDSSFKIVDENTDDVFISTGLGYTSFDKIKNAEYNLGVYHTQNDDNDLNSLLLSLNFIQKF